MNNSNTLERALTANAAFSGITGLAALALAGRLAESLGPPVWSLRGLGAGLMLFAVLVAREARVPGRPGTRLIIAADLAWVVAATVVITVAPGWLTRNGRATLAAVTLVVGTVAVGQWRGLQTDPYP